MEDIIMTNPLLQGVVMFGRERNQVGILVEPRLGHAVDVFDDEAVALFKNNIWFVASFSRGLIVEISTDRDTGPRSRKRTRLHLHSVEYSKK